VLAMVGSAGFDNEEIDGQVNVAFTPQQPGSSIKPIVYLTAFEGLGASDYWYPGTIIWDVPSCWGNYCPTNFSLSTNGPVSARFALGQSLNIPAVKALDYVTTARMTQTLERMGYDLPGETPIVAGLPSALGAIDVYLFDHVQFYATLANGGVRQNAYAIQRIEDIAGNVVFEANTNPEGVQIVSPQHAYLITSILSDPEVKLSSTLTIPGWEAATKTGTTNDNRDVWTMGYTTELAVGVWVGRTDNQPMASTVLGTNTAAPIWNQTMQAGLAGLPAVAFPRPPGIDLVTVCSDTGALFDQATCPSGASRQEVAIVGSQPPPAANQSFVTTAQVDGFSGLLANENCPDYIETRSFINITDQTAIAWINSPAGQAWATARNITTPIELPPTQSCQPGMPRPQVVLSSPLPGQEVSGLVEMRGTVNVPSFDSYEFQLANADVSPDEFSAAIGQVYRTPQAGANSFLGSVNFSGFNNGNYILRLVGRSQSGAEAVTDVSLFVNNVTTVPIPEQPTFAPTAIEQPAILPPTATSIPDAGQGGISIGSDSSGPVPPTPEGQ
jgi:membrane carboxypeptidase/penicillin-binding protein PbpC